MHICSSLSAIEALAYDFYVATHHLFFSSTFMGCWIEISFLFHLCKSCCFFGTIFRRILAWSHNILESNCFFSSPIFLLQNLQNLRKKICALIFLLLFLNEYFCGMKVQEVLTPFLTFIFAAILLSISNFKNLFMLVWGKAEEKFYRDSSFSIRLILLLYHSLNVRLTDLSNFIFFWSFFHFWQEMDFFFIVLKKIFS